MVAWVLAFSVVVGIQVANPAAPRRAIPLDGYSSVPLKTSRKFRGYYWVECEVGGRTVNMIVDTGAPYTVIVPELATRLRLKLGEMWRLSLSGGLKGEAHPSAARLKVGAVDRDSFPIQVLDLSELLAGTQEAYGVVFSGLIGADFLDDYHAVVDFRGRRLLLWDAPAADAVALRGEWRATGLTLRGIVRDGHPSLSNTRFVVDGKRFTLNTGAARLAGTLAPVPGEGVGRLAVSDLTDHGHPRPGAHTYYYEVRGDRLRVLPRPV